jgi:hypothetical protein
LSQSKISKIENGGTLKPTDLIKVFDVLNAPQAVRVQTFAALSLEGDARPQRHKVRWQFELVYDIECQTSSLRAFVGSTVPALLQTSVYRLSLLKSLELTGSQFREAVAATYRRQELLWDTQRRFHFIIPETALFSTPADSAVQIEQLNKIALFINAPNIRLGIIPYQAGLPTVEPNTFVIYDDRLVIKSITGDEVSSQDTDEISEHLNLFAALGKRADYDANSQALIRKAIDYFS